MGVCHNCTDRTSGCHIRCKSYIAEHLERDYYNRQRLIANTFTAGEAHTQRTLLRQTQFDRNGKR
jgi:hypothetical protein